MVSREEWKQREQIEDAHREAEAARVRAAADKECREAAEWSKKCPHVEEAEDEADMPVECCKWCIRKVCSLCDFYLHTDGWCRSCVHS